MYLSTQAFGLALVFLWGIKCGEQKMDNETTYQTYQLLSLYCKVILSQISTVKLKKHRFINRKQTSALA